MNRRLRFAAKIALSTITLFGSYSFGVHTAALADEIDGLYGPGLSDGRGFGINLSIGGSLDRPASAPANAPEKSHSTDTETTPEQPKLNPDVRLFEGDDRAIGVEIRDRHSQPERRVRIAVPFL